MADLQDYPEPRLAVDVAWLRAHEDDPRLRLVDARSAAEYAQGHLPGAVNVDVAVIKTERTDPDGVADFNQRQIAALRAAGITADARVIAYDAFSGASAARLVWVLDYYGHPAVSLLDGGLRAWLADGGDLTTVTPQYPPSDYTPQPRPDAVATYSEIIARLGNPDTVILDTRRRSEYLGAEAHAARSGTIPGAIHLEWTRHLDDAGALRDATALRDLFAAHGITPDKEVIPFCGGGYRSAHAYVVLTMLGYPRVRNYLGSWGEWGNRPDAPIVVPEDEDE